MPAIAADLEIGVDGVAGRRALAALDARTAGASLEQRLRHGHARVNRAHKHSLLQREASSPCKRALLAISSSERGASKPSGVFDKTSCYAPSPHALCRQLRAPRGAFRRSATRGASAIEGMEPYGGSPRRRMESPADCRAPWELTSPAHACLTSPRESPSSGGMLPPRGQPSVSQHGQSGPLAVPQRGSCATSGRA